MVNFPKSTLSIPVQKISKIHSLHWLTFSYPCILGYETSSGQVEGDGYFVGLGFVYNGPTFVDFSKNRYPFYRFNCLCFLQNCARMLACENRNYNLRMTNFYIFKQNPKIPMFRAETITGI